ncbi:MAG: hypothetical protein MJ137_07655 [Clostridia bacterium]|nr:hypothetical protein [Clostridia bacterium]
MTKNPLSGYSPAAFSASAQDSADAVITDSSGIFESITGEAADVGREDVEPVTDDEDDD